jgi:hypothetical protein
MYINEVYRWRYEYKDVCLEGTYATNQYGELR